VTAVLLLNANGEALRAISLQRALSLIFGDKVDMLESVPDRKLRSPSLTLDFPSVLRLRRFVNVPRKKAVWSRRAVFTRDHWKCQYCGCDLDRTTGTIDHIISREECIRRGIRASQWSNTCAACPKCNRRKSNRSLEDSGMRFYFPDFIAKTPRTSYIIVSGDWPESWKKYIEI